MPYKSKEKQNEYQRKRLKARRDSWVDEFGGKCVLCGSIDELQFDHIDPGSKALPIGQIWSRNVDAIKVELAKCQLLCGPCHKAKTYLDLGFGKHGIEQRYRSGCRCDDCRMAHTLRIRSYRARKKAGLV